MQSNRVGLWYNLIVLDDGFKTLGRIGVANVPNGVLEDMTVASSNEK